LGTGKSTETLDSTLAHFPRLVPEVFFHGIFYLRPKASLEAFEVLYGLGGEYYLVSHSGQNIARIQNRVKPEEFGDNAPHQLESGGRESSPGECGTMPGSRPLFLSPRRRDRRANHEMEHVAWRC